MKPRRPYEPVFGGSPGAYIVWRGVLLCGGLSGRKNGT
nr:MAG TPA: hypothetical protein [Bacteriophage sp.]